METKIVATNNEHKLKQFKELYKEYNILTLNDIGYYGDIDETGDTFFENALLKAKTIHEYAMNNGYEYPVCLHSGALFGFC